MNKINLFWPVYKNLEKEFLNLADYIHFSDDQINTYSMHIADLIIRCAIEIEAISKELYYELGGDRLPVNKDGGKRDLYFDTDCLDLLENKWKLGKKQVIVSATTFYFSDETNKILTPLHKANKRGTSGSKWKAAYQAIKHSRIDSLKKATIKNLLNAMGALYILNLYYRDEHFEVKGDFFSNPVFDNSIGSDVFSIFTYNADSVTVSAHMDDSSITKNENNDLDRSVYIIKFDDSSFENMHECFIDDNINMITNILSNSKIQNFFKSNPNYKLKNVATLCNDADCLDLFKRTVINGKVINSFKNAKKEAVINKQTNIYPTIS